MIRSAIALVILGQTVLVPTTAAAAQGQLGILNKRAPLWQVSEWLRLPEGRKTLDVADFKGKVLSNNGIIGHYQLKQIFSIY